MATNRIQSLEIPGEDQDTLASLLKLSDPALRGLETAISQAKPTLYRDELVSQLRGEPSLAKVDELERIVESLIRIAGTSYSAEANIDEVIDAVIATVMHGNAVKLSDADVDNLKKLLIRLAKLKPIELIAKASILSRANDRSFRSVRIVTDLRPICSGEDVQVTGGVIVHELAIRASHNSNREWTYFALDSADLAKFQSAISRAIKKDKALREFANRSNTPILTPRAD